MSKLVIDPREMAAKEIYKETVYLEALETEHNEAYLQLTYKSNGYTKALELQKKMQRLKGMIKTQTKKVEDLQTKFDNAL